MAISATGHFFAFEKLCLWGAHRIDRVAAWTSGPCAAGPRGPPVLWASGLTPQAAIAAARSPFAITHRQAACWWPTSKAPNSRRS